MQKSKNIKKQFFLIVILAPLYACQKPDDVSNPMPSANEQAREFDEDGPIIIGRKLDNPYSVTNMRKAWDTLVKYESDFLQGIQLSIQATHVYVKFDPQNEEEVSAFKRDTTIAYYTYPLDHAIERMGHYYHDPAKPSDVPTYHYASVPVDKELPAVGHEILEQLFIPDEYKDGMTGPLGDNEDVIEALVETSLVLTGNLEAENGRVQGNTGGRVSRRRSSWRPAGRVRVFDDVVNNWRGVEGVIVKARRWFTTHEGMVDGNGNYSCNGTFKRDANYSLDWERHHFALREGWLNGANINGPKRTGNWDNDFNGNKHAFHARVFIGAYFYYYKNIDGLKRPPLNVLSKPQMRIRCLNETGRAHFNRTYRFLGLGNPIKMYSSEMNAGVAVNVNTERMFSTVIHELAHASHWELRKNNWNSNGTDDILKEGWAMGVAWYLTRKVYPWHNDYANMTFAQMRDPNFGENIYTPIIIDLLDNINQGGCCSTTLPIDVISGYSIKNIEDVLHNCKSLSDLRDRLKSSYHIPNQNQLDAFFNQYINL